MLVKNLQKRLLSVPLRDVGGKLRAEKPESPSLIFDGRSILLNEGWNEIDPVAYVLCKAVIEEREAAGDVECKRVKPRDADEPIEVPLRDVRVDQARQIVEGCFNPECLTKWANDPGLGAELRALADIQFKKIREYEAPQRV